jgi:hypothetical protein
MIRVYDKAFSSTRISSFYNAFKGRYGLT